MKKIYLKGIYSKCIRKEAIRDFGKGIVGYTVPAKYRYTLVLKGGKKEFELRIGPHTLEKIVAFINEVNDVKSKKGRNARTERGTSKKVKGTKRKGCSAWV